MEESRRVPDGDPLPFSHVCHRLNVVIIPGEKNEHAAGHMRLSICMYLCCFAFVSISHAIMQKRITKELIM
jgi:hypothetical protein